MTSNFSLCRVKDFESVQNIYDLKLGTNNVGRICDDEATNKSLDIVMTEICATRGKHATFNVTADNRLLFSATKPSSVNLIYNPTPVENVELFHDDIICLGSNLTFESVKDKNTCIFRVFEKMV